MPDLPPRPCRRVGCTHLTQGMYCEEHRRTPARQHDQQRGSAASRGYGSRWRRLRGMVLARDPLCTETVAGRRCMRRSTDVDHIVAKARGGRDTMDNLRGLCHECHSRKTLREDGGFGTPPMA